MNTINVFWIAIITLFLFVAQTDADILENLLGAADTAGDEYVSANTYGLVNDSHTDEALAYGLEYGGELLGEQFSTIVNGKVPSSVHKRQREYTDHIGEMIEHPEDIEAEDVGELILGGLKGALDMFAFGPMANMPDIPRKI